MARKPMSDVIALLPGIMGSVLQRDGKDIWALSGAAIWRGLRSLGGSVQKLRLKDDPWEQSDLDDGITASRLIDDVHLMPGLWKIDGYTKIRNAIQNHFDVMPGQNYFEFPYDWRRDNRAAAIKLKAVAAKWLDDWRLTSGNRDAKLILVGHSMGGLVARYFLECLEGWRYTRLLVTFGTPFRGSLNALNFIVNGLQKKLGPLVLADVSDLLRSFTSVYQLLPIYPCCQIGNGGLVRLAEVAHIPHLSRERVAAALEFHHQISDAVTENFHDAEYAEHRYKIHPVVGLYQPTLQSATLTASNLELLYSISGRDEDGDGIVPRVSATPIELKQEAGAMFAAECHASLQNFDAVIVQLQGILEGLRLDTAQYFGTGLTNLRLQIDDVYLSDEPVKISVKPSQEPVNLTADVTDVSSGTQVRSVPLIAGTDGWHMVEMPPLPPGSYRVKVAGDFTVQPVTDVFGVFA